MLRRLSFGEAGPYEYVVGRVQCEIDPLHPLNRGIVNLDRVPTTPEGKVAYEVDIAFLRPIDSARGNGWLLVEALNRGGTRALHRINDAPATNDPSTLEDAGNGFLMRRFTIAWVAWQGDALPGEGRMLAEFPTPVAADGASIVGRCREETIADAPGSVRDALTPIRRSGRPAPRLSSPIRSATTLNCLQRARYLLAGLQHGSYKPPAPGETQLAANPLDYGPMLWALL